MQYLCTVFKSIYAYSFITVTQGYFYLHLNLSSICQQLSKEEKKLVPSNGINGIVMCYTVVCTNFFFKESTDAFGTKSCFIVSERDLALNKTRLFILALGKHTVLWGSTVIYDFTMYLAYL